MDTSVEDCIKTVVITPKAILLKRVSVDFVKIFSNNPPLKTLKPALRFIIPISKIATPANIFANSGKTTKQYIKTNTKTTKIERLKLCTNTPKRLN